MVDTEEHFNVSFDLLRLVQFLIYWKEVLR